MKYIDKSDYLESLSPEHLDSLYNRYKKIVPVFDYKKVYLKTDKWNFLRTCSYQKQWIIDHILGNKIHGYSLKYDTTNFLIIDVDAHTQQQKDTLYDRVCEIVNTLNTPSYMYRSSKNGGVHMVYNFDTYYHFKDIKASAKKALEFIPNVDIFPSKSQNMRLPLGKDTKIISNNLENGFLEELNFLTIDNLLDHVEQYYVKYEKLTDICKHVKVRRTVKTNKFKSMSSVDLSTVSFEAGNRYHSLINLFNLSRSKEEFLRYCDTYDKQMQLLSNPSKDLRCLSPERRICHYKFFYELFISKRTHVKKKINIVYELSNKEQECIIKYLKYKVPGYHKLSKKEKVNYISFSLKVINNFYIQMKNHKSIYELPSSYLRKLNKNYYKYWKLIRNKITEVIKNYSTHSFSYHCIQYSIKKFKKFINRICTSVYNLYVNTEYEKYTVDTIINYSYIRGRLKGVERPMTEEEIRNKRREEKLHVWLW